MANVTVVAGTIIILIAVVFAVYLGSRLARRITRPVGKLVEAATQLSNGDLAI